MSVVDPYMGPDGWTFSDRPGCTRDAANGATHLREVYLKARPDYTGRVTVPVLWDTREGTIVNVGSRASLAGEHWTATVWGKNVLDKFYWMDFNSAAFGAPGVDLGSQAPPATYGIEFRYSFGD